MIRTLLVFLSVTAATILIYDPSTVGKVVNLEATALDCLYDQTDPRRMDAACTTYVRVWFMVAGRDAAARAVLTRGLAGFPGSM